MKTVQERTEEIKKQEFERPEKKTKVEVRDQDVIYTLLQSEKKTAVLNFASAKNPGGGWLNGSQAQEEAIARSTTMYASIKDVKEFYKNPKHYESGYYDNDVIYSKDLKVFKNPKNARIKDEVSFDMITSCAVNVSALKNPEKEKVKEEMKKRIQNVFELALRNGIEVLILGAFGCGVFKNEPKEVAIIFKEVMSEERYKNKFDQIIFSIYGDKIMVNQFKTVEKI